MLKNLVTLILVCFTLASCSSNIVWQIDLEQDKSADESYVLMGAKIKDRNSRIFSFSGVCRFEETGEDVPCFQQDQVPGKSQSSQVASPSRIDNKKVTKKKGITTLEYANVYLLKRGKYTLHTLKYAIQTGTRTISRGSSKTTDPLVEWSELKFSDKTKVTFNVSGDFVYVGSLGIDLLLYDSIYRPVITKVSIENKLAEERALLSPDLQESIINQNITFDDRQLADVAFHIVDFPRQGEWNSIDTLQEFNHEKCISIFSNFSEGLQYSMDSNGNFLLQTQRFPSFPSFNFSKLMACTLSQHMIKNSYTKYKRIGKISIDLEKKKKFFATETLKYKFPFKFK